MTPPTPQRGEMHAPLEGSKLQHRQWVPLEFGGCLSQAQRCFQLAGS